MKDRSLVQRRALRLQYFTIAWNVGESALAVGMGIAAASIALVGFGADSLIEVFASLVVVWHLSQSNKQGHSHRTATAMRLVALAFAMIAILLTAGGVHDLVTGRRPEESMWGAAFLVIVAVVMFSLGAMKHRIATRLNSAPLRAEARMSMLDGAKATGTAFALGLHIVVGWWWADPAAALLLAAVAAREARDHFESSSEVSGVA